jgi:hypothetical protein
MMAAEPSQFRQGSRRISLVKAREARRAERERLKLEERQKPLKNRISA